MSRSVISCFGILLLFFVFPHSFSFFFFYLFIFLSLLTPFPFPLSIIRRRLVKGDPRYTLKERKGYSYSEREKTHFSLSLSLSRILSLFINRIQIYRLKSIFFYSQRNKSSQKYDPRINDTCVVLSSNCKSANVCESKWYCKYNREHEIR